MPFKVKGLVFIPLQLLLLLLVKANEQMEADKRHHYIVKICVQKGRSFLWRISVNERENIECIFVHNNKRKHRVCKYGSILLNEKKFALPLNLNKNHSSFH